MPRRDPLAGGVPADLLYRPGAVSRAKRNRQWDRAQRADGETCQVSYRGIPRGVNARLVEIAERSGTSTSQVARIMLERGLAAYDARDFAIVVEGRESWAE